MCIEGLYFICTYMTSDDYTSFEEEIATQHWRACSAGGERSGGAEKREPGNKVLSVVSFCRRRKKTLMLAALL